MEQFDSITLLGLIGKGTPDPRKHFGAVPEPHLCNVHVVTFIYVPPMSKTADAVQGASKTMTLSADVQRDYANFNKAGMVVSAPLLLAALSLVCAYILD